MKKRPVAIPSVSVAEAFNFIVHHIAELRDYLLPKLLSGEVRIPGVKEAEREVEEVA